MQFEKKDVGYCGKLSGVRESWLFAEKGEKGEYQPWKTNVNMSRWCLVAGPISSKKNNGALLGNVKLVFDAKLLSKG